MLNSNPNIALGNIDAYPKFYQIISMCLIDEPPYDKTN